MRIDAMNWMQVEEWLRHDDRAVLPLGSTEQHAWLSLAVDSILAARVSEEAAEPLGVPVFPVLPYGIAPAFTAYPGTVSLRAETHLRVVRDVLESLHRSGFRRILVVNGHGGNDPARAAAAEFMGEHAGCRIRFHNWWNAPRTLARARLHDPVGTHASWMENFPWTRLAGQVPPAAAKPVVDTERLRAVPPGEARRLLGDGNFGGLYQRADAEMLDIWETAVAETREILAEGWA
ncbi:creatininase [Pseudoroseomonas rhizosphaerae]|uniref:Creatininase n=1 Tax=Teichococcus rhizosphaerae TaxID=1335062 RepID=A0A2C7AA64_9PROT|nr:creatininase family protein [Pseudoroseomonas rhizosphaerae]PHK97008.1 creatininase [Pseudoroseomonas rhizosphaerae]